MQTIKRELTEVEHKIIELQHHYFLQKSQEGFGWQGAVIKVALLIGAAYWLYRSGPHWFPGILLVVLIFLLWAQVKDFFYDRKESRKKVSTTKQLLEQKTLSIVECKPQRALYFPSYDDEGSFYFFELEENKLLCYHETYDPSDVLIPNDHFSFYADKSVKEVLGFGIQLLGDRIAPIVVMGGIKLVIYDELGFPAHLEIIEGSIEDFLDQAKARILKAGTAYT